MEAVFRTNLPLERQFRGKFVFLNKFKNGMRGWWMPRVFGV